MIYAVYQVLPAQRENKLFRNIGWWTAAAFFLSSLWMFITQMVGDVWFLLVIIVAMFLSALMAFFGFLYQDVPQSRFNRSIMSPLLGLLSGWLSIAVFLSIASVIKASSLHTLGFSANGFAIVIICAAVLVALFVVVQSRGSVWYAGAVLWGITGILVANFGRSGSLLFLGAIAALFCSVVLWLIYLRRR